MHYFESNDTQNEFDWIDFCKINVNTLILVAQLSEIIQLYQKVCINWSLSKK